MKKTFQVLIAVVIGLMIALPAFAADPPTSAPGDQNQPRLGKTISKVVKGAKNDIGPEKGAATGIKTGSGVNSEQYITPSPEGFNGSYTLYKCIGTSGVPAKERILKGEKMISAKDFLADKTLMDDGTYCLMGESEIVFINCKDGKKSVITDPKDHPGVYWACFESTKKLEPKLELPQPAKTATSLTQ
jgi:hypothetical protein